MPSTGTGTDRQQITDLPEIAEKFRMELLSIGRSPLTIAVYRRILADLSAFLYEQRRTRDIRQITKALMTGYADRIGTYKFGDAEKCAWIARIRIFFAWCVEQRFILIDPTARLAALAAKKRKFPVYLTKKEIAKLLNNVPTGTPAGVRDRALLEMLYSSGLRPGEICRLQLADISFADGTVRVLMSKNKKDRMVPIGSFALSWVDRYIKEVHGLRQSGPLFYDFASGNPLQLYQLRRMILKYKSAANLTKHCHARNFRHSFAIHLLENGASIRHIQAMLGHSDLRTTQKYTRIVPEELKRACMSAHPGEHRREALPPADPHRFTTRKKKKSTM